MKTKKTLAPIKGGTAGCINCGCTEELLSLSTKLYTDFGGWIIKKDGEEYFVEEYASAKELREIENEAKLEPDSNWLAVLDLPLRSAVYQRQGDDKWVLVERGPGFA